MSQGLSTFASFFTEIFRFALFPKALQITRKHSSKKDILRWIFIKLIVKIVLHLTDNELAGVHTHAHKSRWIRESVWTGTWNVLHIKWKSPVMSRTLTYPFRCENIKFNPFYAETHLFHFFLLPIVGVFYLTVMDGKLKCSIDGKFHS